nr:DUF3467 domain-containing protein [Candidatus Baldrarchaeota archaeon]
MEKKEGPRIVEDIKYEYYTDVTRIGISERTIVIDFGRITPFKDELIYQARIFMSPEHFIPFVDLMQKFAEKYKPKEKKEG